MLNIQEFGKAIRDLLIEKDPDMNLRLIPDDVALEIFPCADGCLGASFNGVRIPCENGEDWEKSFDTIIDFIKEHHKRGEKHGIA